MASRLGIGLFVAAALTCASGSSVAQAPAGDGWVTLLDGSTLEGWDKLGNSNWRVAEGVIEADAGGTGFLVTPRAYSDFDLEVEFWASPDANSGVFLRCSNPADISQSTCYEVNVYDQRPDPTYATGSIVEFAPPAVKVTAGGQWNTFLISARGSKLTVTFNGEQTVDLENDRYASGPIALQYGAGLVRFRKVRIKE